MGFNVKYDLRCQVNSYLATPTKRNHRILKKISANWSTFIFLKNAPGNKVSSLSDAEGGDSNDEYFACLINDKQTDVMMTKKSGYWHVTSIQVSR